MKRSTSLWIFAGSMAIVIMFMMRIQYEHLSMETWSRPFGGSMQMIDEELAGLPRGIVAATSDMEMKPLWQSERVEVLNGNCSALLAVAVGITQKSNVDILVRKFLSENLSVILFHYDGNVDGWHDLEWSYKAIHICAQNQTKWWFAKRFLHPDVVSAYDYIFLWDEDIGVENFHPRSFKSFMDELTSHIHDELPWCMLFADDIVLIDETRDGVNEKLEVLAVVASEGLEISQPALDPDSTDIHHRITIRQSKAKVHRRIYDFRGSLNCSDESSSPPCTGWVEGMVPVFSRAAWRCVWHLIQNDLIHGWGLDMKLGYCSQGDRTKNVGVVDSEYVMHQGIPSLGGHSAPKAPSYRTLDIRTHIRRQSTAELEKFKKRWDRAAREDRHWTDPFLQFRRKRAA